MSHYLTEFYPKFRDLLIFQITCVGRRGIKIYTAVLNNKFNWLVFILHLKSYRCTNFAKLFRKDYLSTALLMIKPCHDDSKVAFLPNFLANIGIPLPSFRICKKQENTFLKEQLVILQQVFPRFSNLQASGNIALLSREH